MKNYHNSFQCYFSWEEPEAIGLRFTYTAPSILLNRQWSIGSQRDIPRWRYSIGEWLSRPNLYFNFLLFSISVIDDTISTHSFNFKN
ncbi:MAG: hypothetical protein ACKOOA_01245 [Sediminibacterium sp.]